MHNAKLENLKKQVQDLKAVNNVMDLLMTIADWTIAHPEQAEAISNDLKFFLHYLPKKGGDTSEYLDQGKE